ncbi:DNA replication/repair protein RecF [Deferribacter autotrophicus]|uniref:DNA replication/repair protein RecF n=1 Tax=Deferribacter autotrophicus TaxID=500465 RepID=A0A5A8F8Q4_9BACT|nr:AAA family ATPase [Deferribacter autotrophicus]KAA0258852.1 DNA replication/repair protein RecF [Deferribacter autotrophicus]
MILKELYVENVRNHTQKKFYFEKKNYIAGINGAGKTSILEAILASISRKSFRTNKITDIITLNKEYSIISTLFEKHNLDHKFLLKIEKKQKSHLMNGKKIEKLQDIISDFPLIVHSPYYEGLTDKSNRKKLIFIDKILFFINKEYRTLLKNHNRLIEQKRNLLINYSDYKSIKIYNEMLIDLLEKMFNYRQRLLDSINEKIRNYNTLKHISFKIFQEDISKLIQKEKITNKNYLSSNSQTIKIINKDGENVENLLSFGQKKELSIFTVYSSLKVIEENKKDDIIVLLDDFETGLDEGRVKTFYELFSENQLIITGVEKKYIKNINLINL